MATCIPIDLDKLLFARHMGKFITIYLKNENRTENSLNQYSIEMLNENIALKIIKKWEKLLIEKYKTQIKES